MKRIAYVGAVLVAAVMAVAGQSTSYHAVEKWASPPGGAAWGEVPAVAVSADDHVFVFRRSEPPVLEFDRAGTLLSSWGQGQFESRRIGR